jgi:hypothetical protein
VRLRFPRVSPYPTTAQGWLDAALDVGECARAAMASVAHEIQEDDLAREIREDSSRVFPMERYRTELNRRSDRAGDRAVKLASKEFRRRRR